MLDEPLLPRLQPVANPLNLLPVNLKEAALDSPSFRASSIHFGEQIDAVERWLENYLKAAGRLANEVTSIENLVNTYLTSATPPPIISEAALDQDYTVLAIRRYNDGAREFWTSVIKWMKKVETTVVDPIRNFVQHDIAQLKTIRKTLDVNQRNFDSVISRYASQSKTKETSSLREDAFQLHEARRAYLRASMDFCVAAPQVHANLDKLLVKIFSDRWREMKSSRDAITGVFSKWNGDIDRVRGWSKEMETYERVFAQELHLARKQIEDRAEQSARPSRDLDAYSTSTVPYITNSGALASPRKSPIELYQKQGWLFLRSVIGKPARTFWIRRWFYVKDGVFGWLQQSLRFSAVEESEKIGVLLCGVRPAIQEDRRFCFEVKTKDSTLILQAETQGDLMDWIAAFEVVKRKALEDPGSAGSPTGMQGAPFAITPPVAPEFAAKSERDIGEEGVERSSSLAVESSGLTTRASMDIRRPVIDDDGEYSKRDAAARIIQKLDLSRKGTLNPGASASGSSSFGGIASLIAASHSAMPISPMVPTIPNLSINTDFKKIFSATLPNSSLAPSTLALPPMPTTLSKAAIVVGAERGLSLGQQADGNMPAGLMANVWGSSNWSFVNRLEKDVGRYRDLSLNPSQATSRAPSPSRTIQRAEDGLDPTIPLKQPPTLIHVKSDPVLAQSMHRKTNSETPDFSMHKPQVVDDYPSNYPLSLKVQDAQFRMLFPNVRHSDKLVMVFRATWNPSDQQEFPGRIYVTMNDIYFYSNHLGLVLTTGVAIDSVTEITSAPGKDCDFLFIHLREGVRADSANRITIKTFLESQKLLQRRLDYLIHNRQAEEDISLEETIRNMIRLETNETDDSPLGDSWDDIAADVPPSATKREQDLKTNLYIDGSLDPKKHPKNVTKFRLPAHPVEFVPQGFKIPVVEKKYDVTAKSLFHVLAGDKSAVFQILYCQRGAQRLVQGPWVQPEDGHHRREIRYEIINSKRHVEVADYQVIDVLNDHLCYVITERKTAWFLPKANFFTMTLKVVITHVARSQCKLSVFCRVEWSKNPLFGKRLINHQANAHLNSYALSLGDIISDQASRLGQSGTTARKAINIFGAIGQQTQSIQLMSTDLAPADLRGKKRMRYRSLLRLVLYALRRMAISYFFMMVGWFIQMLQWMLNTCGAHKFLVLGLGLSALYNMFLIGKEGSSWWQDRRARNYMAQLGVAPNTVMGRGIWLNDLNNFTVSQMTGKPLGIQSLGSCGSAFSSLLNQLDPSSSEVPPSSDWKMLQRISHNRQKYGGYRHDLLVALRLVGRMEKDMLQAEWEEFIYREKGRCAHARSLLSKNNGKGGNATEALQKWWSGYCESCLAIADNSNLEDLTAHI